jgi:hypothetical protein
MRDLLAPNMLDRSRPAASYEGWEHARTDLCTIHDHGSPEALSRRYVTPKSSAASRLANRLIYAPGHGYRGEPILISEFGGIAFSSDEGGWGYSTVADAEELLDHYEALITALLRNETVQGFCYTQLTDVEQEVNGLLTCDCKPKADPTLIRKITAHEHS